MRVVCSWKLDSSTASASARPSATTATVGTPILPTAGALRPAAPSMAESIPTVVVLPSVPVTVSQGTSGRVARWRRQASSISLQVSRPARSARRSTGPVAGTPGETMSRSRPASPTAAATASSDPATADTTGPPGPTRTSSRASSRVSKTAIRAP